MNGEYSRAKVQNVPGDSSAHIGVGWGVPKSVPKRGPHPLIRQPTLTTNPIKNGPKIVNFRTVFRFLVALANRRLQPLGHLTVDSKYAMRKHLPDRVFVELHTTVFQTVAFVKFGRKPASVRTPDSPTLGTLAEGTGN